MTDYATIDPATGALFATSAQAGADDIENAPAGSQDSHQRTSRSYGGAGEIQRLIIGGRKR
jgi:hypothetical protein